MFLGTGVNLQRVHFSEARAYKTACVNAEREKCGLAQAKTTIGLAQAKTSEPAGSGLTNVAILASQVPRSKPDAMEGVL